MIPSGNELWNNIRDAIVDDTDTNMVDATKSITYSEGTGTTTKVAFMTPWKKLMICGRSFTEQHLIALAALADMNNENVIRYVPADDIFGTLPAYHFFTQEALDGFLSRLRNIIEAAGL